MQQLCRLYERVVEGRRRRMPQVFLRQAFACVAGGATAEIAADRAPRRRQGIATG